MTTMLLDMTIVAIVDQERWPDGACERSLEAARREQCRSRARWMIDGCAYCERHAPIVVWEKVLLAKGVKSP